MKKFALIPLSFLIMATSYGFDTRKCNQWLSKLHPEDDAIKINENLSIGKGPNINADFRMDGNKTYSKLEVNINQGKYEVSYEVKKDGDKIQIIRTSELIGLADVKTPGLFGRMDQKFKVKPMAVLPDKVKPFGDVAKMPTPKDSGIKSKSVYNLAVGQNGECMVTDVSKSLSAIKGEMKSNTELCFKVTMFNAFHPVVDKSSPQQTISKLQRLVESDEKDPEKLVTAADKILDSCDNAGLNPFYTNARFFQPPLEYPKTKMPYKGSSTEQ